MFFILHHRWSIHCSPPSCSGRTGRRLIIEQGDRGALCLRSCNDESKLGDADPMATLQFVIFVRVTEELSVSCRVTRCPS